MQLSAPTTTIFCLLLMGVSLAPAVAQAPSSQPAPAPVSHPAYPTGPDAPLGAQIAALLADPTVSRAHWGIAVTSIDGQPVYGFNEGQLFPPASNNKIFTTATAMALLGPDKTFTTRISGKLDAATGTVVGDLTLLGGGDANFGAGDLPYMPRSEEAPQAPAPPALADLNALVDQLVAKGVKRISGDIVGDDTLYPYEPYAESWAQDDQIWGFGAPVSALTITDNQLELVVTPRKRLSAAGTSGPVNATVDLQQNVPYYKVQAAVQTVPADKPADGIQIERLPGSHIIRVYGSISADAAPDVEELAIADPAEYAAMTLRQLLTLRGITVAGRARVNHRAPTDARSYRAQLLAPNSCDDATASSRAGCVVNCLVTPPQTGDVLASHTSAPLAQDVVLTNKVSQNLHAELFLHNLGLQTMCGDGSTLAGARSIRTNLLHAGLDPDDFLFFDGSGLSDHDLVTPRATATFLAYAAKQPWFSQWKASLPDASENGSLLHRFPDPPVKGHVFAKTGTLGESRGLSGYLDAASGRPIIFSIFVDTHTPATSPDRIVMDKIVTAIAANN